MPFLSQMIDPTRRFARDYAQSLLSRFQSLPLPGSERRDLEQEYVPVRGLAAALVESPALALTGGPGAGKTTALVHLALAHARALAAGDATALVPLFVPATGYQLDKPLQFSGLPRGLSIGDALANRCPAGFFNEALAARRLLVLIDDIDSLPAPAAQALLKEFDAGRIVATGRTGVPGLVEFALPPWRDGEINALAQRGQGSKSDEFVAALKASRVPRSLTSNPLMLSLLARLWRPVQPLPAKRTPLFNEFSESILGSANDTAKMLEDVALNAQKGNPISNEHLARGHDFLRAGNNRNAEFVHELWQAYFAARALRAKPEGADQPELRGDPRGEQTVIFYAGLGNADRLVDELIAQGNYALAGRAAAQAGSISEDRMTRVSDELIERAWKGDANAIAALADMESDRAIDRFAARLKDKDAAVRARAAQILGQLRLERGIEYVLPLLRDSDASVRDQVLAALAESPSDRVVDPLLVVLRGEVRVGQDDARLRIGAIRALGQIASERAVPALLVDLQTGVPEVRAAAAEALKRISSPLLKEPLAGMLQSGDEESRRYAAEILAVNKERSGTETRTNPKH